MSVAASLADHHVGRAANFLETVMPTVFLTDVLLFVGVVIGGRLFACRSGVHAGWTWFANSDAGLLRGSMATGSQPNKQLGSTVADVLGYYSSLSRIQREASQLSSSHRLA